MRPGILFALLAALLVATPARADWKPVEKVETYAISGQSGPDLYASIGEAGPLLGKGRVIAHTNFKLTWTRDYKPQGGACVLKSARPKLIITYTLPKPAAPLAPAVQKSWEIFAAGLAAHEKVHGAAIVEMVRKIEAISVGLTVADDPGCSKIRTELTRQLAEISLAQRQASRDFDKVEFGPGGNLRQLVFNLMTGK
ncbi:DUF922 domain-containing Zn-dependent protease [Mesorhizobium neociceri]|uniref:DUF922 domain-containing protein n=1 Tax=Mesorhizobium neociceri TaxID=1307853 RepID=A0A838BAY9_9HYPH|nr:DUF922 domain-containing protein [Mesorhizobium neociceri]MBA1143423.1 DUF922 domain-containing protein [Mesorhizobium neociceri]